MNIETFAALFDGPLDVAALIDAGALVDDSEQTLTDLQRLSRRISGQYVEVLATWAREAFAGRAQTSLQQQTQATRESLARLAEQTNDGPLSASLATLEGILPRTSIRGGTRRRDFMRHLSEWVLEFADLLEPADAARMRELVSFDPKRVPLLAALAHVRGVGPRRLQRLYSAGLHSLDALARANPSDIADVTGLPAELSARVVEAAIAFAEAERQRLLADLTLRSAQIEAALAQSEQDARARAEVVAAARAAIATIRNALQAYTPDEEEP